ncbi:hypothetical protein RJ639_004105 [Escallonia herrerae]|uniref:Uncharacterized protein n=1 Tax=Escallonia herrerae TaxID=1293975 RepID=A0AA89AY54_9ASTE|nr:hypothetical protein RJ639_004105 [Escallonia herrerae]
MAFVTLKDMGSDFHRLERFDGGDFVRWQRKMHFLLVTVKVYYVIVNPRPPEPGENEEESVAKTRERLRWDQDDEICRGHILNGMSNTLFDAYHTVKTAKELWNQLERRYITEDATSKRFIVSKFFDYKMVDGRSVMEQFNEIKSILDRYSQHKLALDEFIVVTSIIDKLPPSWKNFRNNLKHRKEDINLDELGTHLRIEEDLRKEEKSKSEGTEPNYGKLHEGGEAWQVEENAETAEREALHNEAPFWPVNLRIEGARAIDEAAAAAATPTNSPSFKYLLWTSTNSSVSSTISSCIREENYHDMVYLQLKQASKRGSENKFDYENTCKSSSNTSSKVYGMKNKLQGRLEE